MILFHLSSILFSGNYSVVLMEKIIFCCVRKKNLALVAVDEAHCIPEWFVHVHEVDFLNYGIHCSCIIAYRGEDFRKEFRSMGGLRALTDVPFIALSASAPLIVQSDIIRSLQLLSPVVVSCDINRPNFLPALSSL